MNERRQAVVLITIKGAKPDQNPVSIPAGGQIEFVNTDGDYTTLTWKDEHGNGGTFWNPQPASMPNGSNGIQTAQSLARKKTLKYSFDGGKINTGGSGTVKVGS